MFGMSVNWEKTSVCNLGKNIPLDFRGLKTTDDIQILGVSFNAALDGSKNHQLLASKVEKKLNFWKLRDLSMTGKVLIIKAVILPLLLYTSMIYPPKKTEINRLNRMIFTFFWGAKIEKCNREKLKKDPSLGGYGMPDLQTVFNLHAWIYVGKTTKRERHQNCRNDAILSRMDPV